MDTVYTRGLWDTGDTVSATSVWHGHPRGLPLGMRKGALDHRGGEGPREGCRNMTKPRRCHPSVGTALSPLHRHSLDVAVVEGAIVVHLQREHLSTGVQGTRDSPAATTQHKSQGGSERP